MFLLLAYLLTYLPYEHARRAGVGERLGCKQRMHDERAAVGGDVRAHRAGEDLVRVRLGLGLGLGLGQGKGRIS